MPITLFVNQNGKFKNISEEAIFRNTEGWWNVIEQADFDKDGDIDYVAGNFDQFSAWVKLLLIFP